MIKKLKSDKGSAMQIAIIVILLVGICGGTITSMVINQTKANNKNTKSLDAKYGTESGVEETIGDFIEGINVKGYKKELTEFNIIQLYVQIAEKLVNSNGTVDTQINEILNKIKEGQNITLDDLNILEEQMKLAANKPGNDNPHAKELINIALKYTKAIKDYLIKDGVVSIEDITYEECQSFIELIVKNISEEEFEYKKGEVFGNISVVYDDTQKNYKGYKNLESLYNNFKKDSDNITKEIKNIINLSELQLENWIESRSDSVIKLIVDTEYKQIIDNEIALINGGNYLNTDAIWKEYPTTGSYDEKNVKQIVTDRLEVVKLEIDMIVDWINVLKGIYDEGDSENSQTTNKLTIEVPKNIEVKNAQGDTIAQTILVKYDDENKEINERENRVKTMSDTNKFYRFEIIKPPQTELILNIEIKSELEEYTINSKVDVKIHNIINKDKYDISYTIKDWKKD